MSESKQNRYTNADLEEFRLLIEKKLEKAEAERSRIQERLEELEEMADSDRGDYIDDSSNAYDVEQLNSLEFRQRKHIQDLKNALVRIHNRTYGVCSITGELIDKRRLLAVPTTTKSLEAKMRQAAGEDNRAKNESASDEDEPKKKKKSGTGEKKIISRVIKKSSSSKPAPEPEGEDDDDLIDDLDMPDRDNDDIDDLDSLASSDFDEDDDDF